jgi:hypothetical protein
MALHFSKLIIFISVFGLLCGQSATAQNQDNEALDSDDAEAVASLIKANHDISKAVYLTRIADQLSVSFASQQQMASHWQQALVESIESPVNFSNIDTHALMAQVLIRYSNGMNLNRWRQVDLSPRKPLPKLNEHLSATQQFNVWLNLNQYWRIILQRLSNQDSTDWLNMTPLNKPQIAYQEDQQQLLKTLLFINEFSKETSQYSSDQLNRKLITFSQQWPQWQLLPTILLRQARHQHQQKWIAWAYDWIEIYQHIELGQHLLTSEEQQQLQNHINYSQEQWMSNQSIIEAKDQTLYPFIESIFDQLPVKFKNPDHSNEAINTQILSLATGIQDPVDYFTQPLRDQIQENLEVCLNLSTHLPPNPEQPIADHQFQSCLQEFIDWAQTYAIDAGLAGKFIPLDSSVSMARVLEMPAPQIINYLPAQAVQDQACLNQMDLKPNPVEWLLAVESLNWLHDRWPGIIASMQPPAEDVESILNTGLNLYQYPGCFQPEDVLRNQFNQLEQKWSTLKQAIRLHLKDYRDTQLAKGSDIDFFQDTDQLTDAVPENLSISACDAKTACGAFIQLEPDNKVLQLFPNHLKIAQQLQLGNLSICYDQVGWQERKTLPTKLNNKKIANFEGQLSFTLVGKFEDNIVFKQALETNQRYVYLFAENNQTVLDMACPLPIIGQQITTSLDRGTFGLLPNRLTFLTAQKVDINNIIKQHWPQWQNSINVSQVNLVDAMENIKPVVNETFIQHTNTVQQQIYRKLTTSNPARIYDSALSNAVFEYLTERRRLSATVQALFPTTFHKDMTIRSALTGDNAIPDLRFFKNAYDAQLNIMDLMARGDELFEQHKPAWFNPQQQLSQDFLQPTLMQFDKRFSRNPAKPINDETDQTNNDL